MYSRTLASHIQPLSWAVCTFQVQYFTCSLIIRDIKLIRDFIAPGGLFLGGREKTAMIKFDLYVRTSELLFRRTMLSLHSHHFHLIPLS